MLGLLRLEFVGDIITLSSYRYWCFWTLVWDTGVSLAHGCVLYTYTGVWSLKA
ncbi:Glucans biosynthesis glucosyltransferase H [Gossypium arboreum]|uniref:Glucans biosynthesis glucosyltransferase H n=1 Tax=Gossypium arboreum TaxID=29729 RepID=A0A0B0N322_GOSAR|nr:Glucans biosynthesis glucosyltransferase H [Gossypium arboreum]